MALTSHLIRIFEKILKKRIVNFLESNNLFNPGQHGFRKGRSCLSKLLLHYDEILAELTQKKNVDVAYLDFTKAFDKVNYGGLLNKLYKVGIRGKILNWIESFIKERTFTVVVNGVHSFPCLVISRVPQGSVLGPLLFLVLLCDIDENTPASSVKSFADDTRVMKSISSPADIQVFQTDLTKIYEWAEDNNLTFNDTKFELVQYGLNENLKAMGKYTTNTQIPIKLSENVSDLGIEMSSDAAFGSHIDNVVKSANMMVSWICRTFKSRSANVMRNSWNPW